MSHIEKVSKTSGRVKTTRKTARLAPYETNKKAIIEVNDADKLGNGGFGSVCAGRIREGSDVKELHPFFKAHNQFAVKLQKSSKRAKEEVRLANECEHPFVVEACPEIFQKDKKDVFCMEKVEGCQLFRMISAFQWSESDLRFIIAQLVEAISHLHSKNIVFGDLKPENVMVGPDGYIKLVDFGFASQGKKRRKGQAGTTQFMAPEMCMGNYSSYGKAADWWALGIVVHDILFRSAPFDSVDEILNYNANPDPEKFMNYRTRDRDGVKLSRHLRNFIVRLLDPDEKTRLGAEGSGEVKRHEFLRFINWNALRKK
eukprot:TRINITY_DN510381_c0_g2_i1.p1 TRINITY_DN510381_c0_g2~~TRINITY_DN510381_c0_g2_i1.p1  ORF type:complete len:314 (+),score=81.57 TRINITY_DN510381_c0_g2_i1:63-1004(+)